MSILDTVPAEVLAISAESMLGWKPSEIYRVCLVHRHLKSIQKALEGLEGHIRRDYLLLLLFSHGDPLGCIRTQCSDIVRIRS